MRSLPSFEGLSRSLMDAWISSPDGLEDPAPIYASIAGALRPTMVLLIADTKSGAADFHIDVIRPYRLRPGLSDRDGIARGVLPAIAEAAEACRPAIGRSLRTVAGFCMAADHIVLPQRKTSGRSAWCVGLLDIAFLLPVGSDFGALDDMDATILQMLAEGVSAKEIGAASGLSPRTVEHRIERLKARVGAKSIGHLLVLSIAAALVAHSSG